MSKQQNALSNQHAISYPDSFVDHQTISICERRISDALAHSVDPFQAAQELVSCAIDCASYYSSCQPSLPCEGLSYLESEQLLLVLSIGLLAGRDPHGEKVKAVLIRSYTKIQFSRFCQAGIEDLARFFSRKASSLVSGAAIHKINRFFGCRLVTKSGSTSPINCSQLLHASHGVIVSANAIYTTQKIAQYALKEFFPEYFSAA